MPEPGRRPPSRRPGFRKGLLLLALLAVLSLMVLLPAATANEECPPGCTACSSSTSCDTCDVDFIKNPHDAANPCVGQCPPSHPTILIDDLGAEECASEEIPACSRMVFENSSYTCLECNPGFLIYELACVSSCPMGFFADGVTCSPCMQDCSTCSNSASCDSCSGNLFLHNGTCTPNCPAGTYEDDIAGACTDCETDCAACTSATECTACEDGAFLDGHACVPSCPGGTFGDITNNTCTVCDDNCDACTSATECTACEPAFFMHQNRCECLSCPPGDILSGSTCVGSCPAGSFLPTGKDECQPCIDNCAKCAAGTGICTACEPGFLGDYAAGECYSTCPGDFLTDDLAKTCTPCAAACSSCAGTVDTCTGCRDPAHRLRLHTGECVAACDSGEVEVPGTGDQAGTSRSGDIDMSTFGNIID
ncbi:hypothetical protein H696_03279 [Fonticula alba]|uniref:EGF-like domain-containing protein n=1 Tax=Fonticula alba TaxID=691883 RepID=A0A058Z6A2_FONAL|nr:hypothetical protein H696_03279 [Fonticula alba]KCV69819.1 hypothetical protein H696_03279 [Fonticula alba]|eukprot:XP_009495425.1 hypothetical protein H696_03279 [Fonticula alba]